MSIVVVERRCDGCAVCVPACPFFAIEMVGQLAVIAESCTECGICVPLCHTSAIVIEGREAARPSAADAVVAVAGPLLAAEPAQAGGLLRAARGLAEELGGSWGLWAVSVGSGPPVEEMARCGARELRRFVFSEEASPALVARALYRAFGPLPLALLLPATTWGNEVGVTLAHLLDATLLANCDSLAPSAARGGMEARRRAYGGRVALSLAASAARPAVVTLALRSRRTYQGAPGAACVVRDVEVIEERDERSRLTRREPAPLATGVSDRWVATSTEVAGDEGRRAAAEVAAALGASLHPGPGAWQGSLAPPRLYFSLGDPNNAARPEGAENAGLVIAVTAAAEAPVLQACDLGVVTEPVAAARALSRRLQALQA